MTIRSLRLSCVLATVFIRSSPFWLVQVVSMTIPPPWTPSTVTLHGVSHAYPDSFWRKMTSSVPRRKFSLEDVTWTFDSNHLHLLTGVSSSGKSTILRLIASTEDPVAGRLCVSTIANDDDTESYRSDDQHARPVILDTRPSYRESDSIADIWRGRQRVRSQDDDDIYHEFLSTLLQLPLQSKVSELSTSQVYMCRLGEACLDSSIFGDATDVKTDEAKIKSFVPAPILLIDEWLDAEPTTVVQSVQKALQSLVASGAVVICVTHKPERFHNSHLCRIVLSRGKVISRTVCD